jgi:hypothetical protein
MIYQMEVFMYTSSFMTADDQDNLSVKYTNLYSFNGEFLFLTTDPSANPPYVNKWTNTYGWRPTVKIFETEEQIKDYVNSFDQREEVELALLSDNLWYGNVGHALFDGFYPAYLASVKFGYDNEPFVYLADNWTNRAVTANQGIELFSGHEVRSYPNLGRDKLIIFKTLISGTGRTGNRVINEEYKLYGGKYNALEKFKHRMLKACGATPDKSTEGPIKIAIINNKRYSKDEQDTLHAILRYYRSDKTVDIRMIDWSNYPSFSEQMKIVQEIDIHVTGPGTGMMYMPFLKKGAVNVNLGYMEHTQTNSARPNIKIQNSTKADHIFPGWMEQSVCAGADYVSTLYYNRFSNNVIRHLPLIGTIDKAIQLVKTGSILENNHNIDAQVFIEYCKQVPNARQVCDHLTGIAFFIELFVHEHPDAIPNNIVDVELLRMIKNEMGFDRRYEIKL